MTTETLNVEYADWKLIRTRSSIQLIFEIPLENEAAAYALLGGMPSQGKSRWFKIARLNQQGAAQPQPVTPTIHPTPAGAVAKSYAQQIAIMCDKPSFQKFLAEHYDFTYTLGIPVKDAAADQVRMTCDVDSRRDILEGTVAGNRWLLLRSAYEAWMQEPAAVA